MRVYETITKCGHVIGKIVHSEIYNHPTFIKTSLRISSRRTIKYINKRIDFYKKAN